MPYTTVYMHTSVQVYMFSNIKPLLNETMSKMILSIFGAASFALVCSFLSTTLSFVMCCDFRVRMLRVRVCACVCEFHSAFGIWCVVMFVCMRNR